MKYFAVLLSIYIVFLTVLPCIDKPENTLMQKTVISGQHTSNPQLDADHCSPFCSCNCCSSPKIQQEAGIDFSIQAIFLHVVPEKFLPIVSTPHSQIWQPPQFS